MEAHKPNRYQKLSRGITWYCGKYLTVQEFLEFFYFYFLLSFYNAPFIYYALTSQSTERGNNCVASNSASTPSAKVSLICTPFSLPHPRAILVSTFCVTSSPIISTSVSCGASFGIFCSPFSVICGQLLISRCVSLWQCVSSTVSPVSPMSV